MGLRIVYIAQCLNSEIGGARHHARSFVKAVQSLGSPIFAVPQEHSWDDECLKRERLAYPSVLRFLGRRVREMVALARDMRTTDYLSGETTQAIQAFSPDVVIARPVGYDRCLFRLRDSLRVPLVLEWNAPLWVERAIMRGGREFALRRLAEGRYLKGADGIITVSQASRDRLLLECALNLPILVNPNGIDPSEFEGPIDRDAVRREFGISTDAVVVGQFGKLEPRDSVFDLVSDWRAIVKDLGDVHLVILGGLSTDEMGPLVAARDALGALSHSVHILPRRPHAEAIRLCKTIDIGIIPHRDMGPTYGSSLQIFEYMAGETCIVAPAVGQLKEVLAGNCGLTYEPNSRGQMIRVLREAIGNSELRRAVAVRAKEKALQQYTWFENARRVQRFCESICTPRGRSTDDTV